MIVREEQKPIRNAIEFRTVAGVFETSKVSHWSDELKDWNVSKQYQNYFLLNLKRLMILYLSFEIEF